MKCRLALMGVIVATLFTAGCGGSGGGGTRGVLFRDTKRGTYITDKSGTRGPYKHKREVTVAAGVMLLFLLAHCYARRRYEAGRVAQALLRAKKGTQLVLTERVTNRVRPFQRTKAGV